MIRRYLIAGVVAVAALVATPANAQLFRWWWTYPQQTTCTGGSCQEPEKTPQPPPVSEPPADPEPEKLTPPPEVLEATVKRSRFTAPSVEIADICDEILDNLEERYGKPKAWRPFPVCFQQYRGDGVAGYTLYQSGVVVRVVCYEPIRTAKGGTLDHELTHAFFFYYLGGNFDLFLNEGTAQNSEYRRRESLRLTVTTRYNAGHFWDLSNLYGRNSYDSGLRIYHQGFSVVDFLIGKGGSKWFAEFLKDLQKTKNIDISLSRFYGYKNLAALQQAWLDYLINGQDRATLQAVR